MKTSIIPITIFLITLYSCNYRQSSDYKLDYESRKVVWNDIDSLTGYSKNFKIFFLDSSWNNRSVKCTDSNFIKANLSKIDNSSIRGQYLNGKGFTSEYFLLDTLKNDKFGVFILLLGKHLYPADPSILNYSNLFLVKFSGDKVFTSILLAQTKVNHVINKIKTSILLPDFKIITRTVYHWCDDPSTNEKIECGWTINTDFKTYDPQAEIYVSYEKSIQKIIKYKTK